MCRYLKLLYILFILQQFIIFYKVNSVLYNFINSNFQQEALTVNLTWHKRSISSQSPSDGLWESKFRFFNQEEIRFCYTVLPSQAKKSVIFKQKQQRLKSQWGRIQCTVCHSVHSDRTYTVEPLMEVEMPHFCIYFPVKEVWRFLSTEIEKTLKRRDKTIYFTLELQAWPS